MNLINSKYILDQDFLNESVIVSELGAEIRTILDNSSADEDYSKSLDNAVLDYFYEVSNELYSNECSALVPALIKTIMKTAKSLGIKKINLNVDLITEIIEFLSTDGKTYRKRKTKDKRKAVMDAAMIVFSRNGFHETHVDEIAELAGVAKGTVYRYFKSKEDILKEIIKANNELLTDELMRIFNKDGHILELIKEAVAYYVEFFDNNKDLYRILTHSPWILKDISDHFYKNIIAHLHVVRRRVFNLTREGIVKPTDFYTVFYGIFGFIDGVIQKWFRRNCEYSLKDELPVIIEVLYYGFVSEGERKELFV